jgi:hypothetical protein
MMCLRLYVTSESDNQALGGMKMKSSNRNRKGTVLILTMFMMVALMGLLALAVDLGYLMMVRSEMQRTADAAALAAGWDLIDEQVLSGNGNPGWCVENARATAGSYAGFNLVCNDGPGLAFEDMVAGHIANPFEPNAQMTYEDPSRFNTVWVRIRKSTEQNGAIPLYFARALGFDSSTGEAQATATFINNIAGFQSPSSPEAWNPMVLPFTMDEPTWCSRLQVGQDDWYWNGEEMIRGCDGICELNLYPRSRDDGPPGNRGTVDLGGHNNSTCDIARQILTGLSAEDLAYHGGKLEIDFEQCGTELNGDTGISAAVKDELESIIGQKRIIPIFNTVSNPGDNAIYNIVRWAGIRICEVKLTGAMKHKRVIVQPANVCVPGAIPAPDGVPGSEFVYSPVWLLR